ncbi:MAG: hypothetical protein ACYDCQ_22540, partial [Dehalococcoidia bacterium]
MLSSTQAQFTLPAGLAAGSYDVTLTPPSGPAVTLPDGLTVVASGGGGGATLLGLPVTFSSKTVNGGATTYNPPVVLGGILTYTGAITVTGNSVTGTGGDLYVSSSSPLFAASQGRIYLYHGGFNVSTGGLLSFQTPAPSLRIAGFD